MTRKPTRCYDALIHLCMTLRATTSRRVAEATKKDKYNMRGGWPHVQEQEQQFVSRSRCGRYSTIPRIETFQDSPT
ncbi:hypothetical protein N7471_000607 [Penicillium samsonianum]|uniref:uncharacterized protein n=1 Tax=Penicillium samsonianum TaxID=1882272 RepID=UPI0025468897|nr:uncharacterized protein N7471_000607 [Penicillium samsonianum]KAJ6149408.1 hypothetical protein N7471_000607 [Penicillium samsonianum]